MEKKPTTTQEPMIKFKTYSKNEEVNEDHTNLVKLITRGPRLVHHMNLFYERIPHDCEPIQSKNLHTPLKKLKLIDLLHISFYEAGLENHMVLQNISMNLKSLYFLQDLSLHFDFSNWVSIEGVIHLANALAQMKRLKKLLLNLESCEWVNDDALHLVFRSLRKNKNLQSFKLDLSHCSNVTEKSLKPLTSIFKHSSKSLKELTLQLSGFNFTREYYLEFLSYRLTFLKNLQVLRIDFSGLKFPRGIDFSSFMLPIKHLKPLEILCLDFSSLSISVTALKALAKSFTSLTYIHTLSLHFRWSESLGGSTMEALAHCLQSLTSLSNLTLEFRYSQSINDHALEKLSAGLKTLTNLSEMSLLCDNCPYVGDVGVANVAGAIESLQNLHTVILGFRGCRPVKITYHENLKAKKNIKKLTFSYQRS